MPGRNADEFNWRAPHFIIDVEHGNIDAFELRRRTQSLTVIDNAKEYDTIEWVLRNEDGLLTRTENLALGLLVRVRVGYNGYTANWKTFVVSRMRGGVGVHASTGKIRPAMHEAGALITLSGRNRNAPDAKNKKRGRKGPPRDPKPGRTGRSTHRRSRGSASSSISQLDDVKKDGWTSPTDNERIIRVTRVSDAVREIARRLGYTDKQMRIQDTEDRVNSVVIPMGMTYSEFIDKLADDKGWKGKAEGPVFIFHEERWKEGTERIKFEFDYGGPDVLDLSMDADFRLPDPRKVTVKSYDPISRRVVVADRTKDDIGVRSSTELLFTDDRGQPTRKSNIRDINLRRSEVFYTGGGTQNLTSVKAQRRFEQKLIRSMQLTLQIVGNPHVKARDEIRLSGTGCQLVDGIWYIQTARHVYDGTDYKTELDLRPPSKKRVSGAKQFYRAAVQDRNRSGFNPTAAYLFAKKPSAEYLFTGNDRLLAQASGR